ncbi:Filamin A-interacting protein [Actinidia chinensis var. chinensis]|uniref:Filamin A-interacting protein n=1 Tax=Actinidia chinensis var. chinensis TaxID=1590841 RepID=A0A2R6QNA8_ACTCC|nr:Filamin A-interacting protein [Actinidia chinensis var. chinensis]
MEAEESTKVASSSPPPPPPPHSETLVSETESNLQEEEEGEVDRIGDSKPTSFDQKEILRALEVVERDSVAIAQSYTSLFASLRLALSEVTSSSVDHMQCFSDAAGRLQECALDAATKGNHYINSCLRLNEEMKGIDSLARQLKILKRNVDTLDTAVNRLLRLP